MINASWQILVILVVDYEYRTLKTGIPMMSPVVNVKYFAITINGCFNCSKPT
jgi:hypothetical protein